MAKGKNGNTNALSLQGFEQSTLRILLAQREAANASLAASSGAVRNYLIQLLTGRGLDPQKWGVSPDMTAFVEIQQPAPPAQPGADATTGAPGAPAAFVPPSAPAPAPVAAPAAS